MSNETIRIVGGVIDTTKFTMYKEDGNTIILKQGDPRLAPLLDKVMKGLDFASYVDIQLEELKVENDYEEFEKKSSGIVSFFRVAKAKLKALFQPELIPATAGTIPKFQVYNEDGEDVTEQVNEALHTKEAVAEIMLHAQPVSAKDFDDSSVAKQANVVEENGKTLSDAGDTTASDTIVAVVDGKIIPGVEKIKSQIARAAKMGSTEGIDLFMLRLSAVIEKRQHSVEDLMRFLERGDLPIADDGSILIYKLLYRNGMKDGKQTYVDCHSRQVTQWVGAYVCMDEKMVDHNRRQECSNGLHVARRGYLSGFNGDVCVLAKLAPEDVIAVPHGDANKMRVCGYHIIAELTEEMRNKLQSNRPITDTTEGQKILATALRGQHIGKTHEVRVTGSKGAGVVTKALAQPAPYIAPVSAVKTEAPATVEAPVVMTKPTVEVALENPGENLHGEVVDPNAVVKAQAAALSRKEQAKLLYNNLATGGQEALDAIHAFKKASKVSWERLGLPEINGPVISLRESKPVKVKAGKLKPVKQVHAVDFGDEPADRTSGVDAPTFVGKVKRPQFKGIAKPVKHADKVKPSRVTGTVLPKAEYLAKGVPAGKPVTDLYTKEVIGVTAGSYKDRIQKLLALGNPDKELAQKIYDLKKQSKKSWEVLGVSDTALSIINQLIGK